MLKRWEDSRLCQDGDWMDACVCTHLLIYPFTTCALHHVRSAPASSCRQGSPNTLSPLAVALGVRPGVPQDEPHGNSASACLSMEPRIPCHLRDPSLGFRGGSQCRVGKRGCTVVRVGNNRIIKT